MTLPELLAQWRKHEGQEAPTDYFQALWDGMSEAAGELEDWARHNHPELLQEGGGWEQYYRDKYGERVHRT